MLISVIILLPSLFFILHFLKTFLDLFHLLVFLILVSLKNFISLIKTLIIFLLQGFIIIEIQLKRFLILEVSSLKQINAKMVVSTLIIIKRLIGINIFEVIPTNKWGVKAFIQAFQR